MSVKKASRVVNYLIYLTVRILVCLVQALSFEQACRCARLVAWVVCKVDRRHRIIAADNLQKSFPGLPPGAELDQRVLLVFEHFCRVLIEIIHMPRRYRLHNYKKYTNLINMSKVVELLLSGRPLLFVTGHFGNWEMAGYALGILGFRTHAIARPLDNPYLDQYLRSFRERTGQKLLAKHGDFEQMESVLRQGGVLATLADQDAGQRGLFVDFFGRPASTHKAVALMALEYQVPMVVVGTPNFDDRYHITSIDVIEPSEYEKSPDAVRTITQRFTAGLEKLIRQAPEQYFWFHRRWKHQPVVRKRKQAA